MNPLETGGEGLPLLNGFTLPFWLVKKDCDDDDPMAIGSESMAVQKTFLDWTTVARKTMSLAKLLGGVQMLSILYLG